jgi:hypothetical protein
MVSRVDQIGMANLWIDLPDVRPDEGILQIRGGQIPQGISLDHGVVLVGVKAMDLVAVLAPFGGIVGRRRTRPNSEKQPAGYGKGQAVMV